MVSALLLAAGAELKAGFAPGAPVFWSAVWAYARPMPPAMAAATMAEVSAFGDFMERLLCEHPLGCRVGKKPAKLPTDFNLGL
jgi:hypothetical protein